MAAASFWIDHSVIDSIRSNLWPYEMTGPVWPVLTASMLGKYGDWPQLMVAGFILYAVARRLRRPQLARVCLILMLGSTLAGATVNTLRLTTGRTRPSNQEIQGWVGPYHEGQFTIGRHAFNAFPSGHTATAFGFFGPLLFSPYWRMGLLLLPFPVAIGIARVLTLSHQPSDVLCSIWISLLISAILVIGLERRRQAKKTPLPAKG